MKLDPRAAERVFNISALLDLSFTQFITISIVKLVYVIGAALMALMTLFMIAGAFSQGAGVGIVMLILSPVIFLVWVLLLRIYLEIIVVLFRIAQNTSIMAGKNESFMQSAPPPPPPPPAAEGE